MVCRCRRSHPGRLETPAAGRCVPFTVMSPAFFLNIIPFLSPNLRYHGCRHSGRIPTHAWHCRFLARICKPKASQHSINQSSTDDGWREIRYQTSRRSHGAHSAFYMYPYLFPLQTRLIQDLCILLLLLLLLPFPTQPVPFMHTQRHHAHPSH